MIAFARRAALLLVLLAPWAQASDWTARVDDATGLPSITLGGGETVAGKIEFWAEDWRWTAFPAQFTVKGPWQYSLTGQSPELGFDLETGIDKADEHSLTWTFDLHARERHANVQGGGIRLQFDPALVAGSMGAPTLLPGNRGWAWGNAQRRIEMRFEPPLAKVYVEPGTPNEVRAFFYEGTIEPGQQRFKGTLSVSGDITLAPTLAERFGLQDPATWPDDQLDWRHAPVDLTFLNAPEKPAGKRGFVKAVGERLQFADGTPARFWGTNVTAYALFKSPDEAIKEQARRLSALGFNLVRLHHHDSHWVVPNIYGDISARGDTRQIDPESQRKIDLWVKSLKDEGIYVWLDLHVQRPLTAKDGIDHFAEIAGKSPFIPLTGYAYVNPSIERAMQRFAEQYLTHVNPYTGLAYKDDPAIAAVLLTNENDITQHYGNALLPDKGAKQTSDAFVREATAFAKAHDLDPSLTAQTWRHGPSKLFLNDLEHAFDARMIAHLRSLGVKVPIATTSTWGGNGLSALPALTSGDVVDAHAYAAPGTLDHDPQHSPTLVDWLGAAQVVGVPMTVTEWNAEPFPAADRHSLPLYVAATAGHQGWAATLQYAYSQQAFNGWSTADNWHAYNDPAMLATLPAAALLYRRADVREATTRYVFAPSAQVLFGRSISPASSVLLRTALALGRLQVAMPATAQLPWLKPGTPASGAQVLTDPDQSLLPPGASAATSDTGELRRDWHTGLYSIDTPLTQAVTGWLGGQSIALDAVQVQGATRYASVVVQSVDGQPLGQARRLLISLGTRAVPKPDFKTPFNVEPFSGTLRVKAPDGLKLSRRDVQGQAHAVSSEYRDGYYEIRFDGTWMANWLFLE